MITEPSPGPRRPDAERLRERSRRPSVRRRRWRYGRRGHALAQSLAQLRARPLATLVTLLALGVTLALPALVLFSADTIAALGARAAEGESLTLYLAPDTDDARGTALARSLRERGDVRDTRHVSREEALATFRERHHVGDALDALGQNPLPGAVIVYPAPAPSGDEDPDLAALSRELGALPGVERVQLDLRWVQRLRAGLALAQRLGALLAGFLLLSALLVIVNTVRLELARRRLELEVSRLLGANGAFLYRPVFYTALLYGLLGGLLACGLALLALLFLAAPAAELARLYGGEGSGRVLLPSPADAGLVIAASTGLGLIGAVLTLYGPSRHNSDIGT